MYYKLLLCAVCTVFFDFTTFSQEKSKIEYIRNSQSISRKIEKSPLATNGIFEQSIFNSISDEDYNRLLKFDFSPYRNYNTTQKVQIENGPLLELFSVEKMIQDGFVYDEMYVKSKKEVDNSHVTHQILPVVNIRFGYKSIENSSAN